MLPKCIAVFGELRRLPRDRSTCQMDCPESTPMASTGQSLEFAPSVLRVRGELSYDTNVSPAVIFSVSSTRRFRLFQAQQGTSFTDRSSACSAPGRMLVRNRTIAAGYSSVWPVFGAVDFFSFSERTMPVIAVLSRGSLLLARATSPLIIGH